MMNILENGVKFTRFLPESNSDVMYKIWAYSVVVHMSRKEMSNDRYNKCFFQNYMCV